MAYIGLPYYGYCPITVATNADGSETESLGNGKITRAVVSYGGENDSDSSELWAGDRREQRDAGAPSAKLTIDRSYLSLADEAELCGHHYDESTKTLERKEGDTPALVRVAALGKLKKPDRKLAYRLVGYYRVSFDPVDDNLSTASKSTSYSTTKLAGSAECNSDGNFVKKQEFDGYEEALAALKTFLNIKE
ncbi:hypothetical protein [Gemmiger formicilis]|jgi:hypothetical protein|uniref:hypothetical protein n=1 Tax=Gemmiger formicilis TaxID=745368 RepID=UPI0035231084